MIGLTPGALLRGLAIGVLLLAWAVLAHYGSAGDGTSNFAAGLATAPLLAIVIILLWRVSNPLWMVVGGLLTIGGLALIWPTVRQNVALLYFIQHLGTNLALGILFGRTLLAGRRPLVTHFALLAHDGKISLLKERYTRGVTIAWTTFFFGMATVSVGLFFFASAAAWSAFANLLSLLLIVLMFVVEHLVRMRMLPPEDKSSFADTIRGYRLSTERRRTEQP